jgi:integrase/recombinase XerC
MICRLLIYTWLRVNELSHLKIEDIKEELQIIWKGGIRRVLYLFKEDLAIIDLYLFLRKDNCPYLIVNHSSNYETKRLSNVMIENIIREGWKKIWIEVYPHKLRHTFATNLLRNWAKLPYIQKALWHSNIQTTQTYMTVFNNDIREAQLKMTRY